LIRSVAILLLILSAALAAIPSASPGNPGVLASANPRTNASLIDPKNGTLTAFNYTYSQANVYTNSSSPAPIVTPPTNAAGTSFAWQNTVTETSTNATIPGSGFQFNVTGAAAAGRTTVEWNITIPKPDCPGCTNVSVNFDFNGNLVNTSNASYTLSLFAPNSTSPLPPPLSSTFTTLGSFPSAGTVGCPEIFCLDVTPYIGYHLNLTFTFAWNTTTGPGMNAFVGEIAVASIGNFIPSVSNFMQQDANPTIVDHTTKFSPLNYNNSLSVRLRPSNQNLAATWWRNVVITIYYPSGYKNLRIFQNSTEIFPAFTTNPMEVPFETQNCVLGTNCAQALIALNMTDFAPTQPVNVHNSTITILSTTQNTISPQISTLSGGVATQFFTSGDTIGIKVVNKPSIVNASTSLQQGTVSITFSPGLPTIPAFTSPSTATGGVYNFTLPSNCGFNNAYCKGPITVNAVFSSSFDLGNSTATFRIGQLQVSLTGTGGSNSLSISGTLSFGNGTAAPGINATLFAIDHGIPVSTPTPPNNQTNPSTSRLNIANVSLVNGVFTQGQSLILLFTIVNPNVTQAFNATLTITHDWPGPQPHNMTTSVFLGLGDGLGDLSFTNATARTYKATISFTSTGVQVIVTSLFTNNPTKPLVMTLGTSPVLPNAPHAGLFSLTLSSMIKNQTLSSPSVILSPTYAYVSQSFAPSRLLYASPTFQTGTNGVFTQTISTPSSLLGAQNLTVFILARDPSGVVILNQLPSSIFTQSTALISSADSIGPVGKSNTATATLHLASNSTLSNGITEVITVNLILQGNGLAPYPAASQTGVTIVPGQTTTIQLSFTAPSNVGSYTLTFTSPEYGGVLTSQTLQVTILPGYVQFLIPAAVGVVIAIIVLGIYLIRGKRDEEEIASEKQKGSAEKTRPAPRAKPPSKSLTRTANVRL
jgi:hypothetical protein